MTASLHPRLLLALAGSLVLHIVLLAGRLPPAPQPPPVVRLNATLVVPVLAEPDHSALEKNTISTQEKPKPEIAQPVHTDPSPPKPSPSHASTRPQRLSNKEEQKALRKVSQHILYPPAAIAAGMEGTVHLLFKVDSNGNIIQVTIAASSNHLELDQAAISAGMHLGRIDSGGKTDIILPITFRLQ